MKTTNKIVFTASLMLFAIAAVAVVDPLYQILFSLQADPVRIAKGLQIALWCSLGAISFVAAGLLLLTGRRLAIYRRLVCR